MSTPGEVLSFWFDDHDVADWFKGGPAFDAQVTARFKTLHAKAEACALFDWRETVKGRLAEIIVLDQFSRQIYRGQARAFASDALSLALAQEVVARGEDSQLSPIERQFLYLPFMHSENVLIHQEAQRLYAQLPDEFGGSFEAAHQEIIKRFGRYPHRNAALGRSSTPEEEAFMASHEGF